MHIVAIAWIYVVLMMSITEQSVIAGIISFLLYGVFPLSIILYVIRTPRRKRERAASEKKKLGAMGDNVTSLQQADGKADT